MDNTMVKSACIGNVWSQFSRRLFSINDCFIDFSTYLLLSMLLPR